MAKHGQMMVADDCDFIQMVEDIHARDGGKFGLNYLVEFICHQTGLIGSLVVTRS